MKLRRGPSEPYEFFAKSLKKKEIGYLVDEQDSGDMYVKEYVDRVQVSEQGHQAKPQSTLIRMFAIFTKVHFVASEAG